MRVQFLLFMGLVSYQLTGFSEIPPENRYKIEKEPIVQEPTPKQYSISDTDQMSLKTPPFSFHTNLNPVKPTSLYVIPPYRYAEQIPKLSKWMIAIETGQKTTTYVPAHWLDEQNARGQFIIEPINYLFVVHADNESQATEKLKAALAKAQFTTTWSGEKYHSDNYHAYIGNTRVDQIKRKDGVFLTFSNNNWLKQNDHFRVMGPYKTTINHHTVYLYVSSVSEETIWDQALYAGHFFVSFGNARNNLAVALIENGHTTFYALSEPSNTLNDPKESTEDHDGKVFITIFK